MEYNKEFSIRSFLRFWYTLPIISAIIMNIHAVITSDIEWYFSPFPLAYILFGSFYFLMIRKKIIFGKDYLTIYNGIKTLHLNYIDINRIRKESGGKRGELFVIYYYNGERKKKTKFEIMEFGESNLQEIASLLEKKNKEICVDL